jgi:hypothetical protein
MVLCGCAKTRQTNGSDQIGEKKKGFVFWHLLVYNDVHNPCLFASSWQLISRQAVWFVRQDGEAREVNHAGG